MEFECGNLTQFGCGRMDGVKEIMEYNNDGICTNICCYGCEKSNSCVYKCNRVDWPDEERKINYNDEELRQEKLLGIKCYNCAKEINQEGHKMNIRSDEADCVWLCDDCFHKACGDQSKFENLERERLKYEFEKEEIKQVDYEQLSFI